MAVRPQVLVFDVGPYFIRHALFTDGEPGMVGSIVTPSDGAESFYRALADVSNAHGDKLDGIAISFPGFVDVKRQKTITAGPLPALYKHSVADELKEYLDHPVPVWLENDANCAAIAEQRSGNARKLQDFVLVTVDHGIGGAVFLDGKIHRGRDWRAGEFGMMITNYEAGGVSNLHTYASTAALAERWAEAADAPADSVVATSMLRRLGEPQVREIVERWADYLAVGIFNVVSALDPECVLIGGAASREVTLLPLLREALDRIPYWKDFRTPIKRCRHSGNAGLIGAYYAFMIEVMHESEPEA
ncbi:ROK family protein [Bifidobacterium oedipodis]|uniref:Transcriptional regulator n=1 Tax=Bifidobacterium oedipodis TaxID=2675322 RepID=A0A7Y0ER79_9BIFI|nr:ROK family protein [Bifidobacterium sp. DSM 109957]NMM94927.1 transcriptional regulator [Bifidobacterium sp. DSM 109957]